MGINYVIKADLSSNPLTEPTEYTLMTICGTKSGIAFWGPEEENFAKIEIHDNLDIVFITGFFYSITENGDIWKFDAKDPTEYAKVAKIPFRLIGFSHAYLVELAAGEIFFLSRNDRGFFDTETIFRAYNLPFESDEWIETKDLGGRAIFVGISSTSFSMNSSEIPECRGDYVYFTSYYISPQSGLSPYHFCRQTRGTDDLNHGKVVYGYSGPMLAICCIQPLLWMNPTFI